MTDIAILKNTYFDSLVLILSNSVVIVLCSSLALRNECCISVIGVYDSEQVVD